MIITLEGPDGSGKTTMYEALKKYFAVHPSAFADAIFVDFPSVGDLWPHVEQIEQRDARLFESMYDASKIYITDRFFAVTGPVYARVFNRQFPLYAQRWYSRMHVIYLAAQSEDLACRLHQRGEHEKINEQMEKIIEAYRHFICLGFFQSSIVPSTTIVETEERVVRCVRFLLSS